MDRLRSLGKRVTPFSGCLANIKGSLKTKGRLKKCFSDGL
ncbi:hypothetical protein HMPREF9123_0974 [Neisseria bacilliformis ATCC BAA-1200]|uniref:Uncharacterized protein n=1 Tax=Neisseria bacilliformis ATCC BAA-1200 TaxID=888742 RepID=F2BB70_9NEIS|nr:hypothetical protein HMPREF9123_0974 [Neisseria bacilliformis ATCC BAA-1200]